MAKKAMIEREKKRERLVARYAAKRAELKEIATDESKPMEERFKARSAAQPLPAYGASARLLPQAQDQPDRPARTRFERQAARRREVELVRRG